MLRRIFFALILLTPTSWVSAATVAYSLAIEGVSPDEYWTLPAGNYTLQVFAEVLDNDLGDSLGGGGLLQYTFDLNDRFDSVTFKDRIIFPNFPRDEWDATNNALPYVVSFFRGKLNQPNVDVFAQSGSLNPAAFSDYYDAIGVGGPTLLVSGDFTYHGGLLGIELIPGPLSGHVVFADNGGLWVGAAFPTKTEGALLINYIPEPTTCVLAGLALVGAAARRRV